MSNGKNGRKTSHTSQNGKGDKPRPLSVPREEFEERYDRIFGVHDKSFTGLEIEATSIGFDIVKDDGTEENVFDDSVVKYKCHSCGDYVSEKGCDQPNCTIKE